jgi:hypothetical protein
MTGVLTRFLRDVRLVPIVLTATIALFALKALGLVLDAGYLFDTLADRRDGGNGEITGTITPPRPAAAPVKEAPAASKPSWAQEMFNLPGGTGAVRPPAGPPRSDITGEVGASEETPAKGEGPGVAKKGLEPPPGVNGTSVPLDLDRPVSPAERAILESLQKRRADIDARARELDIREDLLRAAEKRVGGRIDELKELEARVGAALQQKDEGEVARFKNIVTMYENMKPRHQGPARRRQGDQSAPHVRHSGADGSGERAATDRRAGRAFGPEGPRADRRSAQDPGQAEPELTPPGARRPRCARP